jgi:putative heme-binding domain-containing protein
MKTHIVTATVLSLAAGLTALVGADAPAAPATSPAAPKYPPGVFTGPGGAPGGPRQYETEELTPIINRALRGGRDYAQGKKVFETIGCTMCHLFVGGSGGIGPDLSGVGGRFGAFEILQSILEPSAVISDLYGTKIITTKDGKTVGGKLDSAGEEEVTLVQAPVFDPVSMTMSWAGGTKIAVKTANIESMEESEVSLMPPGLINGSKEDEVADLMAYLMSGGNPANRMFQPLPAPAAAATPAAKK